MARIARMACLKLSVAALLLASSAAFINPAFTPTDLVKQSDIIIYLKITGVDDKKITTATVTKVVKGQLLDDKSVDIKTIKLDLDTFVPADGIDVINHIKDGDTDAVMFVGLFAQDEEEGQNKPPPKDPVGYINVAGKWIQILQSPVPVLDKDGKPVLDGAGKPKTTSGNSAWYMEKTDDHMLGTWAGATDMLFRVIDYVLGDPNAQLPVKETIDLAKESQIGKIDGKIYATAPVDLDGNGKLDLFIAAEKGDHLMHWNGTGFDDVTAKAGLTTKSQNFVWGDFNGDGKIDLASFDGKNLSIFSQAEGGTFTGKVVSAGDAFKDGCVGLTTFDSGDPAQKGRPVILVSTTKGSPIALTIKDDGTAVAKPIFAGELPAKDFGDAAECLVADFDNDGNPDIVQLFTRASLYYKGAKPGQFAAPVRIDASAGKGRHGSCIGDWDADGLLDIFTCSEESVPHLWRNMGGGKFTDSIKTSGSVSYIGKPGGILAQTSDFTADGRQGLLLLYGVELGPQLFFNRGFRSFGLCRKLEGQVKTALPQAAAGQQAGCLADFTGSGSPAMVLALVNGEVWFFPQNVQARTMGVNVSLSTASPNAGPVTIWASNSTRPMGASVIRPGEPGMFYGAEDQGTITVKWRFPGGEIQQTTVKTNPKTGVVRLVIDKTAGKPDKPAGETGNAQAENK